MKFYFDEMMPRPCANRLIERGHEVTMAIDVGMTQKDDLNEHLIFAARRSAILVTCDRPFAGQASRRSDHLGVICWTGPLGNVGGMVKALADFAEAHSSQEAAGRVFWLK